METYGGGSGVPEGYGYTKIYNSVEYKSNYYRYLGTDKIKDTENKKYTMIFRNSGNNNNISYWVASPCFSVGTSVAYSHIRIVAARSGRRILFVR